MGINLFRAPGAPRFTKPLKERRPRASQRGYGYQWEKASKEHRRLHPWCARCLEADKRVLCDVADHKVPVVDGGPILDPRNRWSLCHFCHNGWKRDLEDAAREIGDVWILMVWCDDPTKRPEKLR